MVECTPGWVEEEVGGGGFARVWGEGERVCVEEARGMAFGVAVTVSAPPDGAAKNPTAKAVAPSADSTPKAKN